MTPAINLLQTTVLKEHGIYEQTCLESPRQGVQRSRVWGDCEHIRTKER